ncbi:hypothetical protein RFI_26688 [Reticulomyxa filosa]|uniref:Uncharacterized protein n=1 Tax=Reticulomyxa filosa TaxID=46433 RepID=X6M9W3_RETFI|nr:hypothetical protein RFI_26688 [Reticulomyxa filosa]|eukprot:ETO10689.1 hypothetical protein RFI_26688 [Reticulomyxa filosa]
MVKEVSTQKGMISQYKKKYNDYNKKILICKKKKDITTFFFLIDLTFSLQNEIKDLFAIEERVDMNGCILINGIYCIRDMKVTIDIFPEQATWLKVVIKLNRNKKNKEKEEHVKVIYPVSIERDVQVKTQDPQKYVGIPDNHLKISLIDVFLPKDIIILVERDKKFSTWRYSGRSSYIYVYIYVYVHLYIYNIYILFKFIYLFCFES